MDFPKGKPYQSDILKDLIYSNSPMLTFLESKHIPDIDLKESSFQKLHNILASDDKQIKTEISHSPIKDNKKLNNGLLRQIFSIPQDGEIIDEFLNIKIENQIQEMIVKITKLFKSFKLIKVFIDCSGSTENEMEYWKFAEKLVIQLDDHYKFYLWASTCKELSKKDMITHCKTLKSDCEYETKPHCIIPFIDNDSAIILISDGTTDRNEVLNCDAEIKQSNIIIKSIFIHFVKTSYGSIDLSVALPFIRKTEYIIYIDGKEKVRGSSIEDIDLKNYYNKPDYFLENIEEIHKICTFQNAGKLNIEFQNKLDLLKNNLLSYLNKDIKIEEIYNVENKIEELKKIITMTDHKKASQIIIKSNELMRYCDNNYNFEIQNMLSTPVSYIRASSISSSLSSISRGNSPIIMEPDQMALLVVSGEPVIPDNKLEEIIENPFLLLESKEYINKIQNRLDHFIGKKSARQVCTTQSSPFTRKKISSFIPFNKNNDKLLEKSMSDIFFNNRLPRQPILWLAIVYLVCKQTKYLNENIKFMSIFEKFLTRKFENTMYYITLSEEPIEPIIKCPLDIAFWYCLISSEIWPIDDNRNRFNFFGSSIKWIIELINITAFAKEYDIIECLKVI